MVELVTNLISPNVRVKKPLTTAGVTHVSHCRFQPGISWGSLRMSKATTKLLSLGMGSWEPAHQIKSIGSWKKRQDKNTGNPPLSLVFLICFLDLFLWTFRFPTFVKVCEGSALGPGTWSGGSCLAGFPSTSPSDRQTLTPSAKASLYLTSQLLIYRSRWLWREHFSKGNRRDYLFEIKRTILSKAHWKVLPRASAFMPTWRSWKFFSHFIEKFFNQLKRNHTQRKKKNMNSSKPAP